MLPDQGTGIWEHAQALMAFYWSCKYLGDCVSGQRVAAEWRWLKAQTPDPADFAVCGPGAKYNFESDDTGWDTGLYLAAYDVTGDPAALAAAEQSLDHAWQLWWDTALGGGYWYDMKRSDKTSYQAVLTLDNEWVWRLTGIPRFHERAIASERWAVEKLRRDDGLYWNGMRRGGKLPEERIRYLIKPSQSVTMIVGNMAQAVVEVWLYEDTRDLSYLARARGTALGIRTYEVNHDGALINDQDGYTDGWAMAPFAREVTPRLSPADRAAWAATLRASALAVRNRDRQPNGTYGADWDGPLRGGPWESKKTEPVTQPSQVSVSGGAVNVILSDAVLPQSSPSR